MPKRRSLTEGLKPPSKANPAKEAAFVYARNEPNSRPRTNSPSPKPQPPAEAPVPAREGPVGQPPDTPVRGGRFPLTTRLRADIGEALKRASLERQLAGKTPYMVQDILDEALEPWLRSHGYLK